MVTYLRMCNKMLIPFGSVCPTQYLVTSEMSMIAHWIGDLFLTTMSKTQFSYNFQWQCREWHTFAPIVRFWARQISPRVFLHEKQLQELTTSRNLVCVAALLCITFGYFFLSLQVLRIHLWSHTLCNIPRPTKVYACLYLHVSEFIQLLDASSILSPRKWIHIVWCGVPRCNIYLIETHFFSKRSTLQSKI
jgi:hypothetical protein